LLHRKQCLTGSVFDGNCMSGSGIEAKGSMVTLLTGAAMIPAADKANKVGEDAYFISDNGCYFGAPARGLEARVCWDLVLTHMTRSGPANVSAVAS